MDKIKIKEAYNAAIKENERCKTYEELKSNEKLIHANKVLCEAFPYITYKYRDGTIDYTTTYLDTMEYGWRKAFGFDMFMEIAEELEKENLTDNFIIYEIKEKYGGLRFYYSGGNEAIDEIVSKYENESYRICGICGNPAKYISKGWIYPYCKECAEEYLEKAVKDKDLSKHFEQIEDFYNM